MKKVIIIAIVLFCANFSIAFSAGSNKNLSQEITNEVKQTLLYKVNTNSLYSKWGWNQTDVVAQHLSNNNGFKKELNVDSILKAATVDNIEYGNIIGVCRIDFKKLDKIIADNTLQENINEIINIVDEYYVELKCRNVTLSYMNINEDERISHFIEPGILKSDYIKNILPKEIYIKPIIYIIKDNEYIKGLYYNSGDTNNIIMYEDFQNDTNNEQFYISDTITALNKADEKYLIDNPRIDYQLLEQQKLEEIEQLIEDGKQRDLVLYSITAVLGIVLVIIIVVFFKIIKKE